MSCSVEWGNDEDCAKWQQNSVHCAIAWPARPRPATKVTEKSANLVSHRLNPTPKPQDRTMKTPKLFCKARGRACRKPTATTSRPSWTPPSDGVQAEFSKAVSLLFLVRFLTTISGFSLDHIFLVSFPCYRDVTTAAAFPRAPATSILLCFCLLVRGFSIGLYFCTADKHDKAWLRNTGRARHYQGF